MGFYSDFEVKVESDFNFQIEDIEQEIERITDYPFEVVDDNTLFLSHSKWYDSTDDMKSLARQHPNYTFIMKTQGEDGSIWFEYFRGNKMYSIELDQDPPPVDEDKFKEVQ